MNETEIPAVSTRDTGMEQALFGASPLPGLLAVETQDRTATLFLLNSKNEVVQEVVPFEPWVVLRGERRDLPEVNSCELLEGDA